MFFGNVIRFFQKGKRGESRGDIFLEKREIEGGGILNCGKFYLCEVESSAPTFRREVLRRNCSIAFLKCSS